MWPISDRRILDRIWTTSIGPTPAAALFTIRKHQREVYLSDDSPQSEAELAALRRSLKRGCPYGEASWPKKTVGRLGLESTLRPQGRPRNRENGS